MSESELQIHRCHLCRRRYKRSEHLRRHYASHNTSRPYVCNFCSRKFQRSDALSRHLRGCNRHVAGKTRQQTKRRACDRCVRMKKACNSALPCQTCLDRGIDCVYSTPNLSKDVRERSSSIDSLPSSTVKADPSPNTAEPGLFGTDLWADLNDPDTFDFSNTTWEDFLNLPSTDPISTEVGHKLETSLRFLDNFTKYTGFVHSFDCGTLEQRQKVFERSMQLNYNSSQTIRPLLLEKLSTNDPLTIKSREIVASIKEVTSVKPRNSSVDLQWSDLLDDSCSSFFSPANLCKFLELYWSIWHPNVNLIHRPTFDPNFSKPALIATMVIIGACVSPAPEDREAASMWFNSVEETVFIDDDFCDDNPNSAKDFPALLKIQSLQAAYMVCLYQNWEGNDRSKRRIRRHRFSTLVAVARDIGIDNAMHSDHQSLNQDDFNWLDFSAREQLIRIFLWTFLLDTAFVIFNNLPPRMVIKEMKMNMACCEAAFQALTARECFSMLIAATNRNEDSVIFLHSAMENLRMDELSDTFRTSVASLGPLNLFVITSALHSMIFQFQNSFGYAGLLVPLRNALENWKLVWTQYVDDFASLPTHSPLGSLEVQPEDMWRRVGFMRHASEYWLLASLMLDRIEASARTQISERKDADMQLPGDDNSATDVLPDPVLQNYDETSMKQVNDLIADLQRTVLG